jgi:hypothetical protein
MHIDIQQILSICTSHICSENTSSHVPVSRKLNTAVAAINSHLTHKVQWASCYATLALELKA